MLLAHMTLSDKPFMGSVTAPERAEDSVEMCKVLFGAENVGPNCYMTSLINVNSPLVFDAIVRHRPDLVPVETEGPDGVALRHRLWPHRHGTHGFFAAAYERR